MTGAHIRRLSRISAPAADAIGMANGDPLLLSVVAVAAASHTCNRERDRVAAKHWIHFPMYADKNVKT